MRLAPRTVTVVLGLLLIGGMAVLPAAAANPRTPTASHTTATAPALKEYRVHSSLTLDLGSGVQGGVAATDVFKCVNANGEFPFRTTTDLPDKHDLWIDASESVIPACASALTYQTFHVYTTSPYDGFVDVSLHETMTEPGHSGPYELSCTGGSQSRLSCTKTGALDVTITCTSQTYDKVPCGDTASKPKIQCEPTINLTRGQKVVDKHVCTSTGDPLPNVTTGGSPLPPGLSFKRYPDAHGSWLVVNGTVGGQGISTTTTYFIAAPGVAAGVDWDIRT
jgi:hypothetical protein